MQEDDEPESELHGLLTDGGGQVKQFKREISFNRATITGRWLLVAVLILIPWILYLRNREKRETHYIGRLSLDDVAVTIKTGANIIHEKLPIHFQLELNRTIPNLQIYSDHAETLIVDGRTYPVIDILDGVKDNFRDHAHFKPYLEQTEMMAKGGQPTGDGAWQFDKYKFLPLQADAYRRFPNVSYTINIEADTYLFLDQTLQWLSDLNPRGFAIYGNGVPGSNGIWYPHGGSGYLISRGLLDATFGRNFEETLHRTDSIARSSCCGDELLALNLFARRPGVDLSGPDLAGFGLFFGGTPAELPIWKDNYCLPILSMHHVDEDWITALYHFEQEMEQTLPAGDYIRRADVFEHFAPAFLKVENTTHITRKNWSNSPQIIKDFNYIYGEPESEDREFPDGILPSENACKEACDNDENCFMWQFHQSTCNLGNILRIGQPLENSVSGWRQDRIRHFRQNQKCENRFS